MRESGLEIFKRQTQEISDIIRTERGWLNLLGEMYPELKDAADAAASGRKSKMRCACPVHGTSSNKGKGDGFRFLKKGDIAGTSVCNTCGIFSTGFSLIREIERCSFGDAVRLVGNHIGYYDKKFHDEKTIKARLEQKKKLEEQRQREEQRIHLQNEKQRVLGLKKLEKIWSESFDLEDERAVAAQNYFINRGIGYVGNLNDEVRYHPSLPFYSSVKFGNEERYVRIGYFPAIISQIRNPSGKPVAIHRTYINWQGYKLDLSKEFMPTGVSFENILEPEIKKMTASIPLVNKDGASIQLSPAGTKVIGLGEGLETTLAASVATGMPMNCCINAEMLARWVPAQGTKVVFIFKDRDRSSTGEIKADELRNRLEPYGIQVFDFEPPYPIPANQKGIDWADVLKEYGTHAFPEKAKNWKRYL